MQFNADRLLLCSEDLSSSYLESKLVFSMPGHHVHAIIVPAHDVEGDLCFGLEGDGAYRSVGTIMLMSTPSHRLSQYELFHSYAEFSMGPFSRSWHRLGTYESEYGYNDELHLNPLTMISLFEHIHTDIYVFFAGYDDQLDLYVKSAMTRPVITWSHYKVPGRDPGEFWNAPHYVFIKTMDMAEWAPPQAPIPNSRL